MGMMKLAAVATLSSLRVRAVYGCLMFKATQRMWKKEKYECFN